MFKLSIALAPIKVRSRNSKEPRRGLIFFLYLVDRVEAFSKYDSTRSFYLGQRSFHSENDNESDNSVKSYV